MLNRELLSKQIHYDWGLRAVKSVLVIAGELKRAEPLISEDKILMRALRDTNMAKLSRDDVEIFRFGFCFSPLISRTLTILFTIQWFDF